MMIKVTVWNENMHEKLHPRVTELYPRGIHGQLAEIVRDEDISVTIATQDMPEHGLTVDILEKTDVLIWWGHMAHEDVDDNVVERVYERIMKGMGLIALHSAHHSKIFKKLMGTTCNLKWRDDDRERFWCVAPFHPISIGLPEHFELETEEMYGERFDIPQPDEVIFLSWFAGGEVMRSGCTFRRGYGKIFYFQPGHEGNPTFHNKYVKKIIKNAVRWAKPEFYAKKLEAPLFPSLEK